MQMRSIKGLSRVAFDSFVQERCHFPTVQWLQGRSAASWGLLCCKWWSKQHRVPCCALILSGMHICYAQQYGLACSNSDKRWATVAGLLHASLFPPTSQSTTVQKLQCSKSNSQRSAAKTFTLIVGHLKSWQRPSGRKCELCATS